LTRWSGRGGAITLSLVIASSPTAALRSARRDAGIVTETASTFSYL
jgi:hypothetical protein